MLYLAPRLLHLFSSLIKLASTLLSLRVFLLVFCLAIVVYFPVSSGLALSVTLEFAVLLTAAVSLGHLDEVVKAVIVVLLGDAARVLRAAVFAFAHASGARSTRLHDMVVVRSGSGLFLAAELHLRVHLFVHERAHRINLAGFSWVATILATADHSPNLAALLRAQIAQPY